MIDRRKIAEHLSGLNYTVKRSWIQDEHEVMLIDVRNKKQVELGGPELFCECDFDYEIVEKSGVKYEMQKNDPRKCQAKEAVRQKVVKEWQERYGDYWKEIGRKEAIMDIFAKVEAKDYLGQCENGIIYLQGVAELLGVEPYHKLLKEVGQLYAEERLDLNGNILCSFERRFRFPSEIRHLLRYIYSDYSDYADTGDFFLAELEGALTHFCYEEDGEKTHPFSSGKDVFPDDWPNIKPATLAYFGKLWLDYAKARGQKTVLDTLESRHTELSEVLVELCKANDYIAELEEDAGRHSEKIRELSAKFKRAKQLNYLYEMAVKRMEALHRVKLFKIVQEDHEGNQCFERFAVILEPKAVIDAFSRLAGIPADELLEKLSETHPDMAERVKNAEKEGGSISFFDGFNDIGTRLNSAANEHWIMQDINRRKKNE